MKKLFRLFLICWTLQSEAIAQGPTVPSHLQFAGMELRITESVRKDIQAEVDALTRSEKYFNIKAERARQYFPIIEKIFKEENIPDDIKFLVIQESALISDALSSSNAVGFWQFKEASGKEVGLRIDRLVDERLNIVAATRGASRFLKTNNFYFKNWIYSVLAYNTGRGGADQYVQKRYIGAQRMELDNNTHWYVKKFLAHLIAFGSRLNDSGDSGIRLYEYTNGGGKTLNQLAVELNVTPDELSMYNKWLKTNRVPDDKIYAVIVPGVESKRPLLASTRREVGSGSVSGTKLSPNADKYPVLKKMQGKNSRIIKINGISGVIGATGDDIQHMASLGEIAIGQFLKYNDIGIDHNIIEGQVYYLKPKHNKAREYYHTVLPGETLWMISQKYGIKQDQLLVKNRLKRNNQVKSGMVLNIRYIRPVNEEIEFNLVPYISATPVAVISPQPDTLEVLNSTAENLKTPDRITETGDSIINPVENSTEFEPDHVDMDSTASENNISDRDSTNNILLLHIVADGETLYGISRIYNIPVNELMEINEILPGENIKIGQQLYLKKPEAGIEMDAIPDQNMPESYIIYQVKQGDTLYSLSKKFEVSIRDLMIWNSKDSMQLNVGEKLRILKRKI